MKQKKRFRVYLKTGGMTNGEDFRAGQAVFPQEYFVYCKGKRRGTARKGPPLGV